MDNIRRDVFDALLRWETEQQFANLSLNAVLQSHDYAESDRAFFTRLFYGVIERQIALDHLIDVYQAKRKRIESKVRILLRMGLYQILYMDRVPDHAAVSETVELSKAVCHAGVSGFVNGILRAVIRNKDSLPLPPTGTPERLSFESGCPVWLCRMWEEQYGAQAESIALATNRIPPLTLRVNTRKITREALLQRLQREGIAAEYTDLSEVGIRLLGACPISSLSALDEGLCFVQDEASQLCSAALGALPGETVLDACACPGGKSFSIALTMEDRGLLISRDIHASKLPLIEAGAARLGISILRTELRDGRLPPSPHDPMFDRVLCDVPCSGLGVLAKKPDLRHKKPEDCARLPEIQAAILSAASACVKPGGVLVYSTCTLNRQENEAVADAFAASHPDFIPCGESMRHSQPAVTFFPDTDGTDGFFLAKFKRRT